MLDKKKFLNKKTLTILISAIVILGALITIVATGAAHKLCEGCIGEDCTSCGGSGKIFSSIWALLPPVIAIGLALITKEVFSSLFIGILSGAILAADFAPLKTVDTVVTTGLIDAFSGTAGIFLFLIELGVLVCLVNRAGGSRAFGNWAKTHVKTKVGAALCTFVLGILIFIDDYFNCLTVGSVMRPVTDKHKISRSKLAYLIDATAAPICMIAPISSWAAAVSKYVADGQGFSLFIMAIPMNFYSILTLVFIICITLMKFDFGLMKKHEQNAENGDLFSGKQIVQEQTEVCSKGKVIDLVIPVLILIASCVGAIIYNGITAGATSFAEWFSFTDSTVALPWGGLVGLILSIIYFAIRKVVSFKESMESLPKGFIAMVPAILILTFATALKNITGILGGDVYIAQLMEKVPATLVKLLPAIIFVVACLLSFSTGTSWGTFGILIPIVTAMFGFAEGSDIAQVQSLMIVGISACLAGAVLGDHCSPISDITIMSSAGAECEHLNHVSTQLPYVGFVGVVSFVCFIIAGFIPLWYVMMPLSIAIMVASIFVLRYILKKREDKIVATEDKAE
ncbi:MAG: Na+/H+ antiporter NhaC family protein [Clostridia bacterium]|nr:Na+/H+ antiporter NhaC family protein [Clostridia bacterium]